METTRSLSASVVQPVPGISYPWADVLWPFMSDFLPQPSRRICAVAWVSAFPSWRNPFLLVQHLGELNDIPLAEGPRPYEALTESPSPHGSLSSTGSALRTGLRVIRDTNRSARQAFASSRKTRRGSAPDSPRCRVWYQSSILGTIGAGRC